MTPRMDSPVPASNPQDQPYSHPDFQCPPDTQRIREARLGAQALHSRHNPGREIEAQLSTLTERKGPLLVLGLGMGFHLQRIRERWPSRKLVILEPHKEVLSLLGSSDFSRILSPFFDANMELYGPIDSSAQARAFLGKLMADHPSLIPDFLVLPAYQRLYPELTELLHSELRVLRDRKAINLATLRRFGKLWLRNSMRNLELYEKAEGIQEWKNRFRGIPAIVLAAGPSLDQLLPLIPRLAPSFLIVAVDTALAPCLRSGIEPDFAVVVDPQYWNTRHLDRCSPRTTRFVTEISVNPRVFSAIKTTPILAGSLFPLGEILEAGRFDRLGAGGSVSTSAWDFVRYLGADAVYLAGLDLGFPDLQTHVSGSYFEEERHSLASRTRTVESIASSFLHSGLSYQTRDYRGQPLLSDKRMDIYAAWFEKQISQAGQDFPSFSLSDRSRYIEGIRTLSPERLMDRSSFPEIRDEINKRLNPEAGRKRPASDGLPIKEAARQILEDLRQTLQTAKEGVLLLADSDMDPEILLPKLDQLDRDLLGRRSRRVVGFLLEDLIHNVQDLPGPEDFQDSLHRTRSLYEALAESTSWLIDEFEAAELQ